MAANSKKKTALLTAALCICCLNNNSNHLVGRAEQPQLEADKGTLLFMVKLTSRCGHEGKLGKSLCEAFGFATQLNAVRLAAQDHEDKEPRTFYVSAGAKSGEVTILFGHESPQTRLWRYWRTTPAGKLLGAIYQIGSGAGGPPVYGKSSLQDEIASFQNEIDFWTSKDRQKDIEEFERKELRCDK